MIIQPRENGGVGSVLVCTFNRGFLERGAAMCGLVGN